MTNADKNKDKCLSNKDLKIKKMGIDTHQEPIIFLNTSNPVSRSEGFSAMSRVRISVSKNSIIATVNVVNDHLLKEDEVGLSEIAWQLLKPTPTDTATLTHAGPVESFSYVRGKLFGNQISRRHMLHIIEDIVAGRYSQIQLSAFILACLGDKLSLEEICFLTDAMVKTGERLNWPYPMVVDKHCIGGLPGNRTTPIIVSIVTACGLIMPKTSSRAITSPAGTADTMEVITKVNLNLEELRNVVEKEGGCIAWGGTVNFSPSDDKLIQIERALELDSEGQMVASILSKKLAAGSTHIVIDIPVGSTAKVRNKEVANNLSDKLIKIGKHFNLTVLPLITIGTEPIGQGIGPVWEMMDILDVLQNRPSQPFDLRERSTFLAGAILEMAQHCAKGEGQTIAEQTLTEGKAWQKFQAICEAQGGIKDIPKPKLNHDVLAHRDGIITYINNRFVAKLAKLAGAPNDQAAGMQLYVKLGRKVNKGDRLFTLYSEFKGELNYALEFLQNHPDEIRIEDEDV